MCRVCLATPKSLLVAIFFPPVRPFRLAQQSAVYISRSLQVNSNCAQYYKEKKKKKTDISIYIEYPLWFSHLS